MSDQFGNERRSLESGQASPFAVLLAALLGIFVLALLCTGGALVVRQDGNAEFSQTSTAIAQANATTLAQNLQVTATIAAMETEAARPTNTPTVAPTATPTSTPPPTQTRPVVVVVEEETPTPIIFGTSIFKEGVDTPTPIAGAATGSGTGSGTLPQTGIDVGTAVAAALGLLFMLVTARRLRTG